MRLKLRTRITIFVVIILTVCVGLLTFFSVASSRLIFGAVTESIDTYLIDDKSISEGELQFSTDELVVSVNEKYVPDGTYTISVMKEAQAGFQLWQVVAMVLVAVAGGLATNIIIKRALKPLTDLSLALEQIDAGNMTLEISQSETGDEVGSLTKSFKSMITRLQNAFNIQKSFAESAAHELKTPLAIMKSSLQVLMLDNTIKEEEIEESIDLQIMQIDKLTGIVDQLLQITDSNIELNQEIELKDIIIKAIDKAYGIMGSKDIMINHQLDDMTINSNQILLTSIIENILNNAVKYSVNGTINIMLNKTESEIEFSVEDEGIGLDDKDFTHLFEAFYRTDEVKMKQIQGNGLGLKIVKAAVDKLHGEIHVESQKDIGSKFTVKLPL